MMWVGHRESFLSYITNCGLRIYFSSEWLPSALCTRSLTVYGDIIIQWLLSLSPYNGVCWKIPHSFQGGQISTSGTFYSLVVLAAGTYKLLLSTLCGSHDIDGHNSDMSIAESLQCPHDRILWGHAVTGTALLWATSGKYLYELHSQYTSIELCCSATSHSQSKAERVLQTWYGHFVLMLVTIFTFLLFSFPIIFLHHHTTGGPVFRLWSASPANFPLW